MADVTISQLAPGTPAGSNLIPYSTGSNTLSVPVSAMFHNAGNIGIGTSSPQDKLDVNGASNFRGDLNILGTGAPAAGNYRLWEINSGNDAVRLRAGYGDTVFSGMGVSDVALGTLSNHDLKIYANNALHTTFKTNGDVIIPGKLINNGVAKAFGVFDGSNNLNTDCNILKQYNISNIQKLGWSGLYRVTFAESITWPYVPILTGFNNGSGDGSWISVGYYNSAYPNQGQDPTNTSFTIQAYTSNGSYQSQKYISFLVY